MRQRYLPGPCFHTGPAHSRDQIFRGYVSAHAPSSPRMQIVRDGVSAHAPVHSRMQIPGAPVYDHGPEDRLTTDDDDDHQGRYRFRTDPDDDDDMRTEITSHELAGRLRVRLGGSHLTARPEFRYRFRT